MLAATCFSTFDVCREHIPATLATEEDFSIAMQCAVIVHDNTPPSLSDGNSPYLAQMLVDIVGYCIIWSPLLANRCQVISGSKIVACGRLSIMPLLSLWLGYRRRISSSWHALPRPNSRWISCVAEGGHEVHYNLLTGQLLINGKPLGRLPQEIVEHPHMRVYSAQ
jgi:hypothetical protein